MFKKLKQKTKNKKEETLNQGGNLQEQKKKNNSNKRLHIIYILIIINLIIWSVNYIKINNFYEHYLKLLINNAQAEEKDINENNSPQPKIKKEEKKDTNPSLGSKEWIKQQWIEAGADWGKVYAIIQCESQWNPEAHRVNWRNQAGVDRGLYQISSLHHPEISNSCAYNAICSTKKAIEIYKERGNFSAWTCARKLNIHK